MKNLLQRLILKTKPIELVVGQKCFQVQPDSTYINEIEEISCINGNSVWVKYGNKLERSYSRKYIRVV